MTGYSKFINRLKRRYLITKFLSQSRHFDQINRTKLEKVMPKSIRVNPNTIQYRTTASLTGDGQPSIKSGNWDLEVKPTINPAFISALADHFDRNVPWERTRYYEQLADEIANDNPPDGISDERILKEQTQRWDATYHALANDSAADASLISVNIGRDGNLLLEHGARELMIAIHLNVPQISATVNLRHVKWVAFQNQILFFSDQRGVYSPFTHPDLAHFPSKHSSKRADIILSHLEGEGFKTALDIGTNWGYFCHRLEEAGFACTAVENGYLQLYFLKRLRQAQSRGFDCIDESIFDFVAAGNNQYDVVLALSIFHHFIINEIILTEFKNMLHNLCMKALFFEATRMDDKQMQIACLKFSSQDEFADFVLEHTHLRNKTLIYTSPDERNLYMLD